MKKKNNKIKNVNNNTTKNIIKKEDLSSNPPFLIY